MLRPGEDMNKLNEKIEEMTDAIYFYGKDGKGDKKLVDYNKELSTLIASERKDAVDKFVDYLEQSKCKTEVKVFVKVKENGYLKDLKEETK